MLESKGYKRLIASFLLMISGIMEALGYPTSFAADSVQAAAAGIGGIGIAHSVVDKKKNFFKHYGLATIASLLAIARFIPVLAPYVPLLQELAVLFGATAVGQKLGEIKANRDIVSTETTELRSI